MNEVTQEYLKTILYYNPKTGEFTRLVSTSNYVAVGDIAGSATLGGYVEMSVKNKSYLAHRLVFLYMTGSWPKNDVDHMNQIKNDNRWCNLRECTVSQNLANSKIPKNNTSGFKGVTWYKRDKKWKAQIMFRGKHINIGRYKEKNAAAMAYNDKALELFGEFAFLNEIIA